MNNKLSWFLISILIIGYIFLYGPILSLIVFSFNESKLVTVWAGFSTKWYQELAQDQQVLSAAWLSLEIAAITATLSAILGTISGYILARFNKFRGKAFFTGMISARLVMPDVITGLSMLLLFVQADQLLQVIFGIDPIGRGKLTIIIAHTTAAMAFVTVVLQSRLVNLDQSLEEAAQDLGARPLKVFFVITLPIISPAIIAGWLLAFTISLDDVVIASFTSGPGATTLPMVIFSKVRLGLNPEINALATIIIGIVGVGVLIASLMMKKQEKRRTHEMQTAFDQH
ncbi:MAG: ABC transporter permease subunit [Alphaproteobacteria bacterium]|nr:ABC transporter permease subunit [Alphaproteobacteria bacterium]